MNFKCKIHWIVLLYIRLYVIKLFVYDSVIHRRLYSKRVLLKS